MESRETNTSTGLPIHRNRSFSSSFTTAQPTFKASRNEVGEAELALSVCMKILQAFRVPHRRRGKTHECAGHADRQRRTDPRVSELFDVQVDGISGKGGVQNFFAIGVALAVTEDCVCEIGGHGFPSNRATRRYTQFGNVDTFFNGGACFQTSLELSLDGIKLLLLTLEGIARESPSPGLAGRSV